MLKMDPFPHFLCRDDTGTQSDARLSTRSRSIVDTSIAAARPASLHADLISIGHQRLLAEVVPAPGNVEHHFVRPLKTLLRRIDIGEAANLRARATRVLPERL